MRRKKPGCTNTWVCCI